MTSTPDHPLADADARELTDLISAAVRARRVVLDHVPLPGDRVVVTVLLTDEQADGRACLACGDRVRPHVPIGRVDGVQVFACHDVYVCRSTAS